MVTLLKYQDGVHSYDEVAQAREKQAEIGGELFGPLSCLESPAEAIGQYIARLKSLGIGFVRLSVSVCTDEQRPYFHVAFDERMGDSKACYSWSEVEDVVKQRVARSQVDLIALGM